MKQSLVIKLLVAAVALNGVTVTSAMAMGPSRKQQEEQRKKKEEELRKQAELKKKEEELKKREEALAAEKKRQEEELKRIEEERAKAQAEKAAAEQAKTDAENLAVDVKDGILNSDFQWNRARCEQWGDSLPNDAGMINQRSAWTMKCMLELSEDKSRPLSERLLHAAVHPTIKAFYNGKDAQTGRPFYPTWGKFQYKVAPKDPNIRPEVIITNPAGFKAPVDRNAPCNIVPHGYVVVGMCEGGCYTPDQLVLFDSGYQQIGDASVKSAGAAVTVDPASTLDKLAFKTTAVEAFTTSLIDEWNEIVDIETVSGKSLRVTTNHPMLVSDGIVRQAKDLKVGDVLVQENGSPDPISKLTGSTYFGKVRNVRVASTNLIENIVVAQGLLTGTSFYQNEGLTYVNRAIFRALVPESLLK